MAKLQTLKVQYESLKMKDEENISQYFERVENLVNAIQGLGVEVPDYELVENILRTIPMTYNTKVSTLVERENLEYFTWMNCMESSQPMN